MRNFLIKFYVLTHKFTLFINLQIYSSLDLHQD